MAEREIEARNCWYKRIAVLSREVKRKAVGGGNSKNRRVLGRASPPYGSQGCAKFTTEVAGSTGGNLQ